VNDEKMVNGVFPVKRSPLALVVVAFVVALMLYVGYHQARRTGAASVPRITQSSIAPDFSLESLDGKTMRLSDLRGKAVLLNFWATWCGPCKIETPWLIELRNQYAPQGFEVLGVSTDDLDADNKKMLSEEKQEIAKFVEQMKMPYPVLLAGDTLSKPYGGLDALPTSFFVDRGGKVVAAQLGLTSKEDIEGNIRKALGAGN
jgi:thiol-disulfide isomerase/thioredoxin